MNNKFISRSSHYSKVNTWMFSCISLFFYICKNMYLDFWTWSLPEGRSSSEKYLIFVFILYYNNVRNTFTIRLYPDIIVIEHTSFPHFFPDSLVLPVESSMIYLGENSPQVSCDKSALMLVGGCTSHWARSFIPWQIPLFQTILIWM